MNGKDVTHRLADVVVNAPAVPDGLHDGGEIIVQQNKVGRLAGDLGAPAAHGDADVGIFEGGRVVDAVARHGDHLAVIPEGLHDAHLVLRDHPGEDAGGFHLFAKLLFGHIIQHVACNNVVAVFHADFFRDGGGGEAVVAGDHDDTDAGLSAAGNVPFHARPRRVGQADESQKGQAYVSDVVGDAAHVGAVPGGDGDDPQALAGHPPEAAYRRRALFFRHGAQGYDLFGGAFRGDEQLSVVPPDVAHHLELVGEGVFLN
ncbi:hypothetical protein SDC9_75494 [bioreactor metagenome]|uniref:Uncharacterized protein n=1 Tax=bioreactor metagenome TaxID=1076179 RepID=A0A644YKD2_9ZZZZ